MKKIFVTSFQLVILFQLAACATNYKGPSPDFNLKGTEAQTEIDKFSFTTGYWNQGNNFFSMGPKGERYWVESLRPIIKEVSPQADQTLTRARQWKLVSFTSLIAGLTLLAIEATKGEDELFSTDQTIAYYGLLATSIGISYYTIGLMNEAAQQYNQDLRAKFVPKLSYQFDF